MSIASSVFLKRSAMPTSQRWAAAIREAGFALKLKENFDVETFSGFLPCEFEGVAAGFEYSFGEADTSQLSPEQRELIGDRDLEITFVTHSRLRDLVCALAAGSVLAHLSDGVHWDQEAGEVSNGADALEFAHGQVGGLEDDLKNEAAKAARGGDLRPADLSTSQAVEVTLEAAVVFRGGSLLTIETREKPTPRRFDLNLVTQDLPQVDTVMIHSLWECRGREPKVRRFSMKPSGFFKKAVERAFDAWGNLQLEPGQVDLKPWIAKLGQVEAATKMVLAGGAASVPLLLEAARDVKLPAMTRQLAVGVLGALGADAVSALPELEKLRADSVLASSVERSVGQISRKR